MPGCAGAQINSRFVPSTHEYSLLGGEVGSVQQGEASTPPAGRTWRTSSWELCTNRGRRRRLLGPRSHPGASPSLGYRRFWKALGSPSAGWHSARGTCSKASREIHRSSPDLHLFTTPGRSSRDGERGTKERERPGKGRAEVRGGEERGETRGREGSKTKGEKKGKLKLVAVRFPQNQSTETERDPETGCGLPGRGESRGW